MAALLARPRVAGRAPDVRRARRAARSTRAASRSSSVRMQRAIVRARRGPSRGLFASWPTSSPRRSASCAPSASATRTAATRRRSRPTSAASRPPSPPARPSRPTPSTAASCSWWTRPSSAARCTATPARARSPAQPSCAAASRLDARLTWRRRARSARRADDGAHRGGVLAQDAAAPAAALELEVRHQLERAAEGFDVALGNVGHQPVGRERRHPEPLLDLRRRTPRRQRLRDRHCIPQPAHHPVEQPGHALALLAQLEQRSRSGPLVAGHERVRQRPRLALGRARRGLLDLLRAQPRPGAVLQRQLLELSLEPLPAVPDMGDQRPRALLIELDVELRGPRDEPARQLARLDVACFGDLPSRRLDRVAQRRRDLVAALLPAEE